MPRCARCEQHSAVPCRVTSGILEYFTGLLMGMLQSIVLITYQWVVDPAAPGTW